MSEVNSLGQPPEEWRAAFDSATEWFVQVTGRAVERWDAPGLGDWTVRDLVGHTGRALSTLEAYLTETDDPVGCPTAAAYFAWAAGSADPSEVYQRGRAAGEALGVDPVFAVQALAERVSLLLQRTPDDAKVASPAGVMLLSEYLPTRTFELTVHGCDLAVALDLPLDPPAAAGGAGLRVLGSLAASRAGELLLALTGRRQLAAGFSLL